MTCNRTPVLFKESPNGHVHLGFFLKTVADHQNIQYYKIQYAGNVLYVIVGYGAMLSVQVPPDSKSVVAGLGLNANITATAPNIPVDTYSYDDDRGSVESLIARLLQSCAIGIN
ncbi:hypothetical protein CVT26_012751 [Gymnopilus dilepis]|uniref:Uncharacterized protein n=1 Tax=Gymnopilus dilepis TaxID=231916 RepID=A0A409X097_9AGAR|nr:hypothetical protein CVT26_012751 [Gymnopilus dilepis]